jgi:hypothetical protein
MNDRITLFCEKYYENTVSVNFKKTVHRILIRDDRVLLVSMIDGIRPLNKSISLLAKPKRFKSNRVIVIIS